jgi:hypothetical protein
VQLLREGYHEQLFLLMNERGEAIVRKQAKPRPDSTLLTEIAWLEELPPRCRQHFPRVLRSHKQSDGQPVFYEMPYFGQEWVVLSDLILSGAIDRPRALVLLARVMQVMFEGIYPTTYPEDTISYSQKLVAMLEHYLWRIAELPAFRPFIFADMIRVNGEECGNVFSLLGEIKGNSRLRSALRPSVIHKVHGDLYPENILVRIPSLRRAVPQVMILDPIAAIGLNRGDFAMDIAKCKSWLSAELLALRLGLFTIQEEQVALPSFSMVVHVEAEQLRALSEGFLLREFLQLFGATSCSRTMCDEDPHWQRRVSFYEALYALSMVPLVPTWQSLARFLVGIRHLNDFVIAISMLPANVRSTMGNAHSTSPHSLLTTDYF